MKPPGGNYKFDKINVSKYLNGGAAGATSPNAEDTYNNGGAAKASPLAVEVLNGIGAARASSPTTAKIMTASPAELILFMYEQFFELIPDIKQSINRNSAAAMEPDSERAQAIIEELINALDFDIELSKDIGAIYYYVRNRILEANIVFDADIWDDIELIMRSLYDGFKEAARLLEPQLKPASPGMPAGPSIIAGMTYGHTNLKEVVLNTKSGIKV